MQRRGIQFAVLFLLVAASSGFAQLTDNEALNAIAESVGDIHTGVAWGLGLLLVLITIDIFPFKHG